MTTPASAQTPLRHRRSGVALCTVLCLTLCLPRLSEAAKAKGSSKPSSDDEVEFVDAGAAPSPRAGYFGDAYPSLDRGLDHLGAHMMRPHTFGTIIAHRNNEGIFVSPFNDLLGFDGGGLKIVLGLRYGILRFLDVGFVRQNGVAEDFDTYEFDTRVQLLDQLKDMPFDLTVRAGIDWYNGPKYNASGFIAQLLVARLVANWARLGGGFLYASKSAGPTKSDNDAHGSTALMLQAEVRLLDSLAVAGEYSRNLAGYHEKFPIITLGPKIISNRHTFSFVLSNSNYMTADAVVANTYRGKIKQWVLGFHITREIDL